MRGNAGRGDLRMGDDRTLPVRKRLSPLTASLQDRCGLVFTKEAVGFVSLLPLSIVAVIRYERNM